LLGARLGYVLEYPNVFADNPLNIFSLNLDMFNPYAGFGACIIAAIIYGQRKQLLFWSTLDSLTPFIAVIFIAIGISNLASGNAFGATTNLPWGINLWGSQRHPSQVYEIILSTLLLFFVIVWSRRPITKIDGILFLTFLALTASVRLFLEAFRGDSVLTLYGIRTVQLASWLALAISLWALGKRFSEHRISSENQINLDQHK
jgi:prolipoprotein diacylglyceryltransferase